MAKNPPNLVVVHKQSKTVGFECRNSKCAKRGHCVAHVRYVPTLTFTRPDVKVEYANGEPRIMVTCRSFLSEKVPQGARDQGGQ